MQDGFELACICDHAMIRRWVEAFQKLEIRFGMPDHLADSGALGRACQPYPAASSSFCRNEAASAQIADYLHQMILGDLMEICDFRDRCGLSLLLAEIEQDAQRIVRMECQAHDSGSNVEKTCLRQ